MRLFTAVLALVGVVNAFNNPFFWQDVPDLDIRRINNTYYYSASSFHYSPGAPILRSYDLIHWEFIGHSVPELEAFGSAYTLTNGQRAYRAGIWASFFNYHAQKDTWFWGGCTDFWYSHIFSAPSVTGPWNMIATIQKCYYDCGLLIDDDGTMYVSHVENNTIWVAQLSVDGTTEVNSQQVWVPPDDIGYCEGTRMYKLNGLYYIITDHPDVAEIVLKSTSPWGNYTYKYLIDHATPPTAGGNPRQGALIDTLSGQWYYMAFMDTYPLGRTPLLAPIGWGSDGFPTISLVNNTWGSSYPDPLPSQPVASPFGVDYFTSSTLGAQYEWNHDPDTTAYSIGNGLVLRTTTPVTNDLFSVRNQLLRRIVGPKSTATMKLLYGNMKDGDRAGLAMFRDTAGWIGVLRDNGTYHLGITTGIQLAGDWRATYSVGTTVASKQVSGGTIWLRAVADAAQNSTQTAVFSYSADGKRFSDLGSPMVLNASWDYFLGYRFGIFNYGTVSTGGSVKVQEFRLDAGAGTIP